ncbi:MAG: dihydropteroate synthase [Desulfobulbaceae bacterium]|nr:dihydropteroate synthase [Desulfobulbaceae bacterium]
MGATAIKIMGILNVTPDSFSDGGKYADTQTAITQAEALISAGADILDVGGESTRPFADPVSTEEELRRVIPVIEAVRQKHTIPISIDTTKATVARKALKAGADIINDVSALSKDPEMITVVQQTSVPLIIMHMQGTPTDMQIKPVYSDVITEIIDFFSQRIDWITGKGVDRNRLIIDPGIGFGKTLQHNLSILKHLAKFSSLNLPLLLGHSRKRFLGTITDIPAEAERDLATAVVTALSASQNVAMVRVHDVAATRQALLIAAAIGSAV